MSSTTLLRRAGRCGRSRRALSSISSARSRGANIDVHPEVLHALETNQPVVALETALVTHGLPAPLNFDTAYSMERIVRSTGAVPATIAFVGGRVKIGLEKQELERLAESGVAGRAVKVSRRDIAATMVKGIDGGTTIAATMIFAAMAGIKVFATGGLGGVHRNGENTMDVSADLQELSKCPVGVVSSGVKSILDIGRTLEYLETLGVPVLPYQSPDNEFPAFFTPKSGFKLPWGVNSPLEAAQIIHTQHILGLQNGQLIAVPIPSGPNESSSSSVSSQGGLLHQTTSSTPSVNPASAGQAAQASQGSAGDEVDLGIFVQSCVDQAVAEAEENGMARKGKEVTPWLLGRVRELTGGRSLDLNVKLLERAALVGGQIAVEYSKLTRNERSNSLSAAYPLTNGFPSASSLSAPLLSQATSPSPTQPSSTPSPPPSPQAKILIAGCAAVDVISKVSTSSSSSSSASASSSTAPGAVSLTLGGVARNVAEACHRVLAGSQARSPPKGGGRDSSGKDDTVLVSPVGDDAFGRLIRDESADGVGMRVDGLFSPSSLASSPESSEAGAVTSSQGVDGAPRTAVCNMVLDAQGDLIGGVADMGIVEASLTGDAVVREVERTQPSIVCIDGNLTQEAMRDVVMHCVSQVQPIDVFFEPTSVPKSTRILPALATSLSHPNTLTSGRAPISFVSPNTLELKAIYQAARMNDLMDSPVWWETIDMFKLGDKWRMEVEILSRMLVRGQSSPVEGQVAETRKLDWLVRDGVAQMAVNLLPFFQHILVKCGQHGVVVVFRTSPLSGPGPTSSWAWANEQTNVASRTVVSHYTTPDQGKGAIVLRHLPPLEVKEGDIVNVTGAGDSFVGLVLADLARSMVGTHSEDKRAGGVFDSPEMLEKTMERAQRAAVMSLGCDKSVSPLLGSLRL